MKQDETNAKVLAQLQEYAQLYFEAVLKANTDDDGKCLLKPGKYSANELADNSHRSVLGRAWVLPFDTMFDETVAIEAGDFKCSFPYRRIFVILAKWEAMMRAGKQKAVFEIGDVEVISAKVLTREKTELGAYKEKRMKLQKLHGNWYAPARIKRYVYNVDIYYEHENVIFSGGQMSVNMLDDENRELLIMRLDKAENSFAETLPQLAARNEYFAEACKRMGIEAQQPATATETPQIPTEAAEAVNCTTEGGTAQDAAYMQPYNIKYFVDKFGDIETLDRAYSEAVSLITKERAGYETDTHKGGRFRNKRIEGLGRKINALQQEHGLIRRAMERYFKDNPPQAAASAPQPPETPPEANRTAAPPEARQRPQKRTQAAMRRGQAHTTRGMGRTAAPPCGSPHCPPGIRPTANPPPGHGKRPGLSTSTSHPQTNHITKT